MSNLIISGGQYMKFSSEKCNVECIMRMINGINRNVLQLLLLTSLLTFNCVFMIVEARITGNGA